MTLKDDSAKRAKGSITPSVSCSSNFLFSAKSLSKEQYRLFHQPQASPPPQDVSGGADGAGAKSGTAATTGVATTGADPITGMAVGRSLTVVGADALGRAARDRRLRRTKWATTPGTTATRNNDRRIPGTEGPPRLASLRETSE